MNIRAFCEKDYPRLLEIYSNSKLDELRFEKRLFQLLPLENDEKRLSALKESKIFVFDDGELPPIMWTPLNNLKVLQCPSIII